MPSPIFASRWSQWSEKSQCNAHNNRARPALTRRQWITFEFQEKVDWVTSTCSRRRTERLINYLNLFKAEAALRWWWWWLCCCGRLFARDNDDWFWWWKNWVRCDAMDDHEWRKFYVNFSTSYQHIIIYRRHKKKRRQSSRCCSHVEPSAQGTNRAATLSKFKSSPANSVRDSLLAGFRNNKQLNAIVSVRRLS